VPDEVFIDPRTGTDRWVIREAMRGRLPDEVRLNRRLGVQAADVVPRLRATAGEVEDALTELDGGPAAAYLDVPYMRETWKLVQRDDTPESFRKAGNVLLRGIMAGVCVNSLDRTPSRPPAPAAR
jgi:asparagine synthase (glutamine-hydrolysing)